MSRETEPATSDVSVVEDATTKPRSRLRPVVASSIILLLLLLGLGWYFHSAGYEETDDAQVDGHLNPVASRIDGTITAVYADDNQVVQAGALLVELDPRDDQVTLQQKQAQYDQAIAQLKMANPNLPITRISNLNDVTSQHSEIVGSEAALAAAQQDLESASAKLRESEAVNRRDQADYSRYQALFDKQEVARAEYEQYRAVAGAQTEVVRSNIAEVASAQKTVEQRGAQLAEQRSKLQQIQSSGPLQVAIRRADIQSQQASAEAARAALEQSRLTLTYGRVTAPVAGVVTERSAEMGARIAKGEQLFMIVQTANLWVTANFKETQLEHIHPGQSVRVHVDALHKDFDALVESMPAITGSRTSVLPPENATGNYVKVVQRLPVRIRFVAGQNGLDALRPGMSVEPEVHIK